MAAERATRRVAVGGVEGDVSREKVARRRIDLHAVPARCVRGARGRESDIEESRVGRRGTRLKNLGDDVADEAVVLMTVAAFRAPREHDIGVQLIQRRGDAGREPVERLARPRTEDGETGVLEAEQDGWLRAELTCGATRLVGANLREAVAGGDVRGGREPLSTTGGRQDRSSPA